MRPSSHLLSLVTVLLGLCLLSACSDDISPGHGTSPVTVTPPKHTATAEQRTIDETYEAVGTVRPRTETRIEAQVTGRIRSMKATAGDLVERGTVLAELDDREYVARMEQAKQALASAMSAREQSRQAINESQAAFSRAQSQYRRSKQLYAEKAISSHELEAAEADFLQTEARLAQARDGLAAARAKVKSAQQRLEEVEIALEYTVVRAPEAAEVARRMAEPGDLAVPGKPLFILQSAGNTAGALRLEAHVRESLIGAVRVGRTMRVALAPLDAKVDGIVEEVVPAADPTTRTFLVKVSLPPVTGLYPGMFGRLLVPSGSRTVILVPRAAITRVGQLEALTIRDGEAWHSIYVKTGDDHGDKVEILSGLRDGDEVALPGGGNGS